MSKKNYTFLYLEGFNKFGKFIVEAAIEEQNINSLFNDSAELRELIDLATEDQLRYMFYKIKNDLPSGSVTSFIDKCIEATRNSNYQTASNEILNLFQSNYSITFDQTDTRNIVKLYRAFQTPADLSQPAPPPFQDFGNPYTSATGASGATGPDTGASGATGASSPPDDTPGSTGGLPGAVTALGAAAAGMASGIPSLGAPGTPPAGPGSPTNLNRRGEQLRQGSTYRRDARSGSNATRPISPAGGPTYYVRTAPGQYRPAVRADMTAKIPLYIKNPNPVGALVKPYVQVADEVRRARRASPSDAQSFDKEMRARGAQRLAPSGETRREADGSVRRKSQFGGALGSLSNLMGDVGNTLKKGSR